jgi:tripartite-type tricarboxylate transporter receptor subunit TctC
MSRRHALSSQKIAKESEMNRSVRSLCVGVLGVFGAVLACSAQAQEAWPNKPVQMVVPWAAGGSVDSIGRAMGSALSEILGQQVVVMNRVGAAGTIGTATVANAKPDGYIVGWGPITPITNAPHLMKSVTYKVDSFDYVCQVFENMFTVAVPQDSPIKSLPELLTWLAANPGKATYGHLGVGSISHLSMENVLYAKGIKVVDAPYAGDAALLPDLQTGRVAFGTVTVAGSLGRPVRVLAVFSDKRHPGLPDVPTVAELKLPSLQPALNGIFVAKGTAPEVVRKLEGACEAAVKSEPFRTSMQKLREPVAYYGRDEFTKRVARDYSDKAKLVKILGLQPQ